jgi:uncharacterized membrane protein YgcG
MIRISTIRISKKTTSEQPARAVSDPFLKHPHTALVVIVVARLITVALLLAVVVLLLVVLFTVAVVVFLFTVAILLVVAIVADLAPVPAELLEDGLLQSQALSEC